MVERIKVPSRRVRFKKINACGLTHFRNINIIVHMPQVKENKMGTMSVPLLIVNISLPMMISMMIYYDDFSGKHCFRPERNACRRQEASE